MSYTHLDVYKRQPLLRALAANGPDRGGVELVQAGKLTQDQVQVPATDALEFVARDHPAIPVGRLLRANLHRHLGGKVVDLVQEVRAESARGEAQCDVAKGPW